MRARARLAVAARKICTVIVLGVVTIAMVIAGANAPAQTANTASPVTIATFDVPGAANTIPAAINGSGRITGYSFNATGGSDSHGFVRDANGNITPFDVVGAAATNPAGINKTAQIAGSYADSASRPRIHGFVRDAQGNIAPFDAFGAYNTVPVAINDSAQITGYYLDSSPFPHNHGFVRDAQGNIIPFDPSGAFHTFPAAINGSAQITGFYIGSSGIYHGFMRDAQGNITPFDVSGAVFTLPAAINAAGQVTGSYLDSAYQSHGFVRDAQGNITPFDVPGGVRTVPLAINASARITGYYVDSAGQHGFVRDAKGQITSFDASRGVSTFPVAINDSAQITGYYADSAGHYHGFLAGSSVAVIILPGLPGSWTPRLRDAIATGKLANIPALIGDFASMVRTHLAPAQMREDESYDDLINALKGKGIDVFVMPWDWANGGYQQAAADLEQFVRERNFDKVDIIAHSAGGLVAQQYIHNRLNASGDPHVRNLILLGTPNRGTLLAHCGYYLEPIPCAADNPQARQIAFAQVLLNALVFPLTVAQGMGAVHDLMPTFAYLQLSRSLFAPFNNTYLQGLNQQTLSGINRFLAAGMAPYTVRGTAVSTPGIFVVRLNTNRVTRQLKPWSVTNIIAGPTFSGDGSTLTGSATIPGFTDLPVPNATHVGGLLNCIKEAYPRLRDTGTLACGPQVRRANTYISIQTGSPIAILLADPRGRLTGTNFATGSDVADIPTSTLFQGDHPGIFIDEAIQGKYTLEVLGTGKGGEFELSIIFPNAFPTGLDATGERFSRTIRPGQRLQFAFDALAFQGVTNLFTAFHARLEINSASRAFEMNTRFTLGAGRTISPATQPVTIQMGTSFLVTIPAGSFRMVRNGTRFVFEGTVNGVAMEANLTPTGGNAYSLKVEGAGARDLPGGNPVEVRLGIGNNGGSVSVNAEFER